MALCLIPQHQLSDHQPQTAAVLLFCRLSRRRNIGGSQQPHQPEGRVESKLEQPPQSTACLHQVRETDMAPGF